jgi:hypothetical protein
MRDFPIAEKLAKPGGRAIGEVGIKVIKALLRYVLAKSKAAATLREGGGKRGEFDLTLATPKLLVFVEVKAKPLIAYPVTVFFDTGVQAGQHRWLKPPLARASRLQLLVAATNQSIPLSKPSVENFRTWPLEDIANAVAQPAVVRVVIDNWFKHLAGYRMWEGEPPATRWHRFGCGNFAANDERGQRIEKRVANTKELPGLDRTDDIKKGAAQLIKFSRFKFDCQAEALRAILLGNTYAETHADDYIDPCCALKLADRTTPALKA